MRFEVELGATVRDIVTGFSGLVTARCDYISGCNQYLVQPRNDKDDKYVESRWFDENRLHVQLNKKPITLGEHAQDSGPDAPAPRK